MRRFGDWLATTKELQSEGFGVDYDAMRADQDKLANYLTWNFTAIFEELGEMMHELPWAPWKRHRGSFDAKTKAAALSEAVDVLHFIGNVLVALDVTDEELSAVYVAKQDVNRSRLLLGRSHRTPVT